MRRFTQLVLILLALATAAPRLTAFSLTGPAATWMTIRLGYDLNAQGFPAGQGWGGGGPMNLGEEYRLNTPSLTYGFSAAFQNYFGQRGIDEVEKAIAILNALPTMDSVNINDYPLNSLRINHRAEALNLADVRSVTLSLLLNEMGLSDPTRWVYTLRNRWIPNQVTTNYFVIKRNFDPDTWQHSSFINGQLWTYTQVADISDSDSFVITAPVDPLAMGGFINAPVASGRTGNSVLPPGGFWTGLTRDDVGGLHYIYRSKNYNIENAPTNSLGAGLGSSSGGDSPWTVPVVSTNAGTIAGSTTNFVDSALRPGIGKISFERMTQESQLGPFFSNTVRWVDRYITNNAIRQQTLVRAQVAPDILFDAGDLQGGDGGPPGFVLDSRTVLNWSPGPAVDGTTTFGPGVIPPGDAAGPTFTITYNTVGPMFLNSIIGGRFFVTEESAVNIAVWGSFDGSADEPFVYPSNTNTEEIEQLVLGGSGDGSGSGGSLVDTWTPSSIIFLPVGTATGGTTTGTDTTTTP